MLLRFEMKSQAEVKVVDRTAPHANCVSLRTIQPYRGVGSGHPIWMSRADAEELIRMLQDAVRHL